MNASIAQYLAPRPDMTVTEHRAPLAMPREDPFFHGWGPRI